MEKEKKNLHLTFEEEKKKSLEFFTRNMARTLIQTNLQQNGSHVFFSLSNIDSSEFKNKNASIKRPNLHLKI